MVCLISFNIYGETNLEIFWVQWLRSLLGVAFGFAHGGAAAQLEFRVPALSSWAPRAARDAKSASLQLLRQNAQSCSDTAEAAAGSKTSEAAGQEVGCASGSWFWGKSARIRKANRNSKRLPNTIRNTPINQPQKERSASSYSKIF